MNRSLPFCFFLLIILSSCLSASKNTAKKQETIRPITATVAIPAGMSSIQMTELDRTTDGSFVLAPGFYESEFKSFCLQPGTPDPSAHDAYLQAPMSGYRKDIVETILYQSRIRSEIPQRNIQILLWSVVSGSDFNKLPSRIQEEAVSMLSSKQLFELKGGVQGMIKTVSGKIPYGMGNGFDDIRRLFEIGNASYESIERLAVLRTPSQIKRPDYKIDQWYKQQDNYYVRYFPISYQKIRIQVYVPDGLLDSAQQVNGNYLIFDPTSWLAVPANSNAQRLGVGAPVVDIIKKVIQINTPLPPKKIPPPTGPKQPRSGT